MTEADGHGPASDRTVRTTELFRRYAADPTRRKRNELVEAHLGLAHHFAARFRSPSMAAEDLHQVAMVGLVKAVDRFDPERGVAFSTFAGRTIEGELKRHFRDASWGVRVPRSTKELHLAVRRAADDLSQSLGRAPTVSELAGHVDASVDDVLGALGAAAAQRPESIDAPAGGEGDEDRAARLAVEEDFGAVDRADQVERLMDVLDEREREIVRLRFYERLTQDEIADRVGISQMHVSRLLRRSFEAMRAAAGE